MGDARTACVVVLGDLGRSPRMCNHALSLAEEGVRVSLVGYHGGAEPPEEVRRHRGISLVHMRPFPEAAARRLPRILVNAEAGNEHPTNIASVNLVMGCS